MRDGLESGRSPSSRSPSGGLAPSPRPRNRPKATLGGVLTTAFVAGAALAVLALAVTVRLDSIAVPSRLCEEEIVLVIALLLVYAVVRRPAGVALGRSNAPILELMRRKAHLPGPIRAAALALFIFGTFAFAFWAVADVVGGYNGYGYVFFWYPVFPSIYNHTIGLIPFISSRDKGTQASLFMGLATVGLVLFRMNKGVGAALRDVVTLFVAPCLVVFELALWSRAPEDMSWHVTDFLSIGGIADGGIRQRDFQLLPFHNYPAVAGGHYAGAYVSGPYVFSNWFVLAVALVLVASRVPWMSLPSVRPGGGVASASQSVEVPRVGLSALGALLSRRHSGFCGLNRLDESAKADHYSRKLCQASRIEIL